MTPTVRAVTAKAPTRRDYDVVIVGAGVLGLFTAHHLALKMDPRRIIVLDRGFLSSGASGRNGGGVRQQWETVPTIHLAQEAVKAYREFPRQFGFNPWFRQGGYLFLALSQEEQGQLERVQRVVRSQGLPAEWLSVPEVRRRVPSLATDEVLGASYLGSDGVIFPFPVLWGLASDLRRRGVELVTHTEVTEVTRDRGRVTGVVTPRGTLAAGHVVNAAGGWSHEVSRRAGLTSPNHPTRHEILATEPLKPFLEPMVVTTRRGLYFSQSMRGEVIGGISPEPDHGASPGMGSSPTFLTAMARELTSLVPALRQVRVLRSWAGFYDDTPDGLPVLGEDPRLPGFVQANGFGGHGFMLAPAAAPRVATMVLGGRTDLDPALMGPGRFQGGATGARTVERLQLG